MPKAQVITFAPSFPAPPLLEYRRLRLRLRTVAPWRAGAYKGSPWRGAFGNSLKRTVCPFQRPHCDTCMLRRQCLYLRLFETPREDNPAIPGGTTCLPHPLVLCPPLDPRREIPADTDLHADMALLAPAFDALPYLLLSFIRMGERGLGPERAGFSVEALQVRHDGEWQDVFRRGGQLQTPPPVQAPNPPRHAARLTLRSLTPLHLKQHDAMLESLDFPALLLSAARRLQQLHRLYQDGAEENEARFSGLDAVKTEHSAWETVKVRRYSSRQQSYMSFQGITGSAVFSGDLAPFAAWLQQAEALHIGSLTSFGFGRFELVWG